MSLFNIATNNIKKNFKNYWAYFLSTTFSVFVIYLFLSILTNSNVTSQLGSVKKFVYLFNISSYLIAIFSAFFIWYSNSFFIKTRKKEFATYMLLGMTKKQTARLNLIENLVIMILAFFSGIAIGVILNKFFVMLLFTMIKTSGIAKFTFSPKAFKYCLLLFSSVFILISLHSTLLINKNSLIDLFSASKKAEKGLKVSFFTFLIGILALVFLGYGYFLAIVKLAHNILYAPLVVIFVVIGTILFMIGTVSTIIYLAKRNEKKLFKGTHLISTSQLFYRYKGNVGTLSVIGIATTVALCAMTVCFGLYNKTEENSRYMRPFSVEYFKSNASDSTFKNALKDHSEVTIKSKDNIELLKVTDPEAKNANYNYFYILGESDFKKINSHENIHRDLKPLKVKTCYYVQMENYSGSASPVGKTKEISLKGKSYNLKVTGTDTKPFMSLDHFKETLVVTDSFYNELKKSASNDDFVKISGYMLKNDFVAGNFVKEILKKMPKDAATLTFYDHFDDSLKLMGMMCFIGIFIGLTFLTATGSIIYFKMNMEAKEDKPKFKSLIKIGVSRKEIKGAVARELLVFFSLPFFVASISSYAASICLSKFLTFDITKSFIYIIIAYAVLYSIYYFITLNSYTNSVYND